MDLHLQLGIDFIFYIGPLLKSLFSFIFPDREGVRGQGYTSKCIPPPPNGLPNPIVLV